MVNLGKLSEHPLYKSPKECIAEAVKYVQNNLYDCCEELMIRSSTGVLKQDGYIKAVANILKFEGNEPHALKMAEEIVHHESMLFVLSEPKEWYYRRNLNPRQ